MSALPDILAQPADYYLVSHGKAAAVGSFLVRETLALARGDKVIVETARGQELGSVLGPASVRQARLLGEGSSGTILRAVGPDDGRFLQELNQRQEELFEESRRLAEELNLPLAVLDVDVLLGGQAIIQVVFAEEPPLEAWIAALESRSGLKLHVENLAQVSTASESHDHEGHDHGEGDHGEGGCGKPDCGKKDGGSCSTCGSGGGCSSCAKGSDLDLRQYFGHLRDKLEKRQRTSLL